MVLVFWVIVTKEYSGLDYLQNFNGGETQALPQLYQSLKGKAGAGEPSTPLTDEFQHILAHWAVRGL